MSTSSAREQFRLECNFHCLDGAKKLDDHVYFRYDDGEKSAENDIPESGYGFVRLTKTESLNGPFTIKLCPVPGCPYDVEAVDVICNARHLEVYSSNETYLETSQGTRIDEVLGLESKAFMLQHSFEGPVSGCILKLPKVTELLLYSIHITVVRGNRTQKTPTVDDCNPLRQIVDSLRSQNARGRGLDPGQVGLEGQSPDLGVLMSALMKGSSEATPPSGGVSVARVSGKISLETGESLAFSRMTSMEDNLRSHMDRLVSDLERKIMSRLDRIEQMIVGSRTSGPA